MHDFNPEEFVLGPGEVRGGGMRVRLSWFAILVLMGTLPSLAAESGGRPKRWSFELGTMIGYHSNVFAMPNTNGQPTVAASISTLYLNGDLGTRHTGMYFGARGSLYTGEADISGERWGLLGLMLKSPATRIAAEYERSPTKVYVEEAGEDFFELERVQLKARLGESTKVWMETRYGREEWTFDSAQLGQNAEVRVASATLRFPIARQLGLRASYDREWKVADDPQYSRDGEGRSIAIEAEPSKRIRLFGRYMVRTRSYQDAPVGSDNFAREDTIEDATLTLRVEVGKNWGIRIEDSYKRATSNLPDRNYHTILAKAGIFLTF